MALSHISLGEWVTEWWWWGTNVGIGLTEKVNIYHFNQTPVTATILTPSLCTNIFVILLVIQRSSLLHCSWHLWVLVSGFLDLLSSWIGRNFSFTDILSPFLFVSMCLLLLPFDKILIAKRNRHVALINHLELTTFPCIILLVEIDIMVNKNVNFLYQNFSNELPPFSILCCCFLKQKNKIFYI